MGLQDSIFVKVTKGLSVSILGPYESKEAAERATRGVQGIKDFVSEGTGIVGMVIEDTPEEVWPNWYIRREFKKFGLKFMGY
jgi:hypothetical protein